MRELKGIDGMRDELAERRNVKIVQEREQRRCATVVSRCGICDEPIEDPAETVEYDDEACHPYCVEDYGQ